MNLERKHPLRGGLRFVRSDEQAAVFGPQTLKQREDAGVRSALGEGAAKIEVTECGHMPGDFHVVGVRADFAENTFQRWADYGELHPRDRIARVTQDCGNGFENVRRAIHKRAVKVKENGRKRERGKLHQKLLACPAEKPQASPYEGVCGKAGFLLTAVCCRRLTHAALRRFPLSLAHGLLVKRVGHVEAGKRLER